MFISTQKQCEWYQKLSEQYKIFSEQKKIDNKTMIKHEKLRLYCWPKWLQTTMRTIMGLEIPQDMTGNVLV